MSRFDEISAELQARPRRWLVTGAAGFIGSHLVDLLLSLGQEVTGLDDFSTGHRQNLPQAGLDLIEGDIRDPATCARAVAGADYVLHQAALGSVPWSVEDPLRTHAVNVTGFLNIAFACREAGARLVYAASSASYGDRTELPAQEDRIGVPLSPYAASKTINEIYAAALAKTYGLEAVGLRYFNVFGPRQDPAGAYAAVIPRWVAALIAGQPVEIYGDGETSRDFCYVGDVARANVLAALAPAEAMGKVYNIAGGREVTLNRLLETIGETLRAADLPVAVEPLYREFRPGDVRHSRADISRAGAALGFAPETTLEEGLALALPWYRGQMGRALPGR